jgi:hypothetical protein
VKYLYPKQRQGKRCKTKGQRVSTKGQVLTLCNIWFTPCSNVSQIFYKRKLSCYDLSTYSLADQTATCYLWDESEGGRGASEIGTCLLTYLQSLPRTVTSVSFYSDSCTGQNRNQYIAAILLYAVRTIPHLDEIKHAFLESGHTQMECDSMQSPQVG